MLERGFQDMLTAERDPYHPGARGGDAQVADFVGPPRLARTVSMLQIVGSLLAIPVGLASAYSIYRANFSVETTCQALRNDIISMIDKRVDASTRRILARHDVEKFEATCGSIDPDATAAFKNLLAADMPATAAAAPASRASAEPAKQTAHRAEPAPTTAEMPASAWPGAKPDRAHREAGVSDAQWLDAVRLALVQHDSHRTEADAVQAPAMTPVTPPPVARPAAVPVVAPPVAREAAVPVAVAPAASAVTPSVAPALPPAAAVAVPPSPPAAAMAVSASPPADPDHPVPPAAIPNPADEAVAEPAESRSRIRRWIARVPLLGPMWDRRF